ncbi:MAG: sugar ABC transporter permease, partial [Clostridia bacterium]
NGVGDWSRIKWVGLKNYVNLFSDKVVGIALKNNMIYMLTTVLCMPVIAFFLALFIEKFTVHKGFFRTAVFTPIVLPLMLVALLFTYIYNLDFGIINGLLRSMGLDNLVHDWLGEKSTAFAAVMAIPIWKSTPFTMTIILAGMQNVSRELEEAAMIDGCTFWKTVRYVTLPQIKSVLTVAVGLVVIDAFRVFDLVYMTTNGGPGYYTTEVMGTYIYKSGFADMRMGYAAALSVLNIAVVMLITGIYMRVNRKIGEN